MHVSNAITRFVADEESKLPCSCSFFGFVKHCSFYAYTSEILNEEVPSSKKFESALSSLMLIISEESQGLDSSSSNSMLSSSL